MPFCAKCGTEAGLEVNFCSNCGNAIAVNPNASEADTGLVLSQFDQKLHMLLVAAIGIAVYLIYTSWAYLLITGLIILVFGLSFYLFFNHKKLKFAALSKTNCVFMLVESWFSLLLCLMSTVPEKLNLYPTLGQFLLIFFVHMLIVSLLLSSKNRKA